MSSGSLASEPVFGPPRLVGGALVIELAPEERARHVEGAIAIVRAGGVEHVPDPGALRIETDLVTCAWPHGLVLTADPAGRSPFVLLGPAPECEIWLTQAARSEVEPIESLAAEGQRVRAIADAADGTSRIDLDYVVEDELFWQRKYVRPWGEGQVLLVCAQAPAELEDLMSTALELVESTLRPTAS